MSQFLAGSVRADRTDTAAVENEPSTKPALASEVERKAASPLGEVDTNAGGPAPLKRSKRCAD